MNPCKLEYRFKDICYLTDATDAVHGLFARVSVTSGTIWERPASTLGTSVALVTPNCACLLRWKQFSQVLFVYAIGIFHGFVLEQSQPWFSMFNV